MTRIHPFSALIVTLALALAFSVATGCAPSARAQRSNEAATTVLDSPKLSEERGALMLVREPRHVRAAIVSMRMLQEQDPSFASVKIFVLGPAIHALNPEHELAPLVREALAEGMDVSACVMSAENQGIPDSAIMPEVGRVENALVESLRLQQQGYSSVEL